MDDQLIIPGDLDVGSELDLGNEIKIRQVLELLLWGDEHNKKYSVAEACKKVGISRSTYYRLRQQGMVEGPKQQLAAQVSTAVQEVLLPIHQDRYVLIARIAMGLPPYEGGTAPTIADILNANKMIDKILPVQPIDKEAGGIESPLEHIKNYQPKTINFNIFSGDRPPDWLYNGHGTPRFGEIEGEVEEAED
jgi:hypothetical protein